MIEADSTPFASLRAAIIRRSTPMLALPSPDAFAAPEIVASGRGEDIRFFLTCYAAGLIFFLVMLS